MARRFLAHCFALVTLGVCVPALHAQDHLLDDLYGRGVHAYFSRNYQDAHRLLSDALTSGSKDPRVYYFRALTDSRLNRPDDATADLKKAAELEFGGDEPVNVSKALERIQGGERLMIEEVRSKARISIRNAAEDRAKIRYENRVKAEAGVLRRPPAAGVGATPPPPAPAEGTPAAAPDKTDPFGTGTPEPAAGEKPATPAAEKPAAPAAKPAAPAKPAADDPFGEAPAKPAVPTPEKPVEPAAEEKPAAEAPGEVKPASATAPAAPSGKGSILGSFARAFSKAVPGEAKVAASAPAAPPPVEEPPPLKVDPNTPDPFGDAPAAKPAKAAAPGAAPGAKPKATDPFSDDPAKPAAPAKAAPKKPAEDDPFK